MRSSARVGLADATGVRQAAESLSSARLLDELTDIWLVPTTQLAESSVHDGSTAVLAVLGRLSEGDLAVLSGVNTRAASARAVLLDVGTFAGAGSDPGTARAAQILTARGWQVAIADARTSVPLAWELLNDPAGAR